MRNNLFILTLSIVLTIGLSSQASLVHALDELSKAERSLETAYRYIQARNASKADAYLKKALQNLRRIQDIHLYNPKFHFLIGKYYYLNNDFSGNYYKHFDLSGEYKKDAATMFNAKGHLLLEKRQYVRALLEFRDACSYDPGNCDTSIVPIYIDYSRGIIRNGQLNEGIRMIETLSERYPGERAGLARALFEMSLDIERPLAKIKLLAYGDKIDPEHRNQVVKHIRDIVDSRKVSESQAVDRIAKINPQLADAVQQKAFITSEHSDGKAEILEERTLFSNKMKASFPGVWKNNFNNVFTFNSDGTCQVKTAEGHTREGTWDIVDKKLIMKNAKNNKTYTHDVILYTGDSYILKGENQNYYGRRIK